MAPKPYGLREHVGDTCAVTAAVGWVAPRVAWFAVSTAAVGVHVIASALALAAAVGAAWVVTDYASRRFATLHVDADSIAVEPAWPRGARKYSWAELQEWRRVVNARSGSLRVQLRFTDGCRVRLYLGKHDNWKHLVRTLNAVMPARGKRRRAGKWPRGTGVGASAT